MDYLRLCRTLTRRLHGKRFRGCPSPIRRKTLLLYSIDTAFITGLSAGFLLAFIDESEKQDLVNMWPLMLIAVVMSIVVSFARLRQQSAA